MDFERPNCVNSLKQTWNTSRDIQWHDLRRAVVIHLESMEERDTLIIPRIATRQVCHHIINQKPCPKLDRWNSMRGNLAPGVSSNPWRRPTQVDLDATPNHMSLRPAIPWDQTPTGSTFLHRPQLPTCTCTQLALRRTLGLSMVGATWIQHRSCHRLHTQRWPDWYVHSHSQSDTGHNAIRWWGPLPQVPMACTDPTAWDIRRHDCHRSQPTSQPRQWTTSQRQSFYTTPAQHTQAACHSTETSCHPSWCSSSASTSRTDSSWLTPETNWEEDPWTRAEREHAEQQEARAKAKAPPPPAPYSAQEPPAAPPVTPSINPPRQHRVEQTPINRAFETLRQTAGSTGPEHSRQCSRTITSSSLHWAYTDCCTSRHQPHDTVMELDQWFPTTPSPPRIPDTILGAWFERPPIQFTRQLPPTHMHGMPSLLWEDSSFQLNSKLLTEFTSLLENHYPGEHWHMGHNHTGQHDTTGFQAINTSIAFSWSPWPPKHKPPTPLYSSFGGTNISCSPGMWYKNASPIVVRGPPSYQTICRPFFWLPSTSWKWLAQWDHPMNFANQKVRPWPP